MVCVLRFGCACDVYHLPLYVLTLIVECEWVGFVCALTSVVDVIEHMRLVHILTLWVCVGMWMGVGVIILSHP